MHAAVITITIDPAQAAAAAGALMSDILPTITGAPGFTNGYWLEPTDGQGFAFILFDTEEHARAATPPAIGWTAPGVEILDVRYQRVAVSV